MTQLEWCTIFGENALVLESEEIWVRDDVKGHLKDTFEMFRSQFYEKKKVYLHSCGTGELNHTTVDIHVSPPAALLPATIVFTQILEMAMHFDFSAYHLGKVIGMGSGKSGVSFFGLKSEFIEKLEELDPNRRDIRELYGCSGRAQH